MTSLHLAAIHGSIPILNWLLSASDAPKDTNKPTSETTVVPQSPPAVGSSPLSNPTRGIDLVHGQFGTPLCCAASRSQIALTRHLLELGASVSATSTSGGTPLHFAAAGGCVEIIDLLIAAGADIEARNDEGQTPLLNAVLNGGVPAVEALVAIGADVTARENNGQGVVHIAASRRETAMLAAMLNTTPKGQNPANATTVNGTTPLHLASMFDLVDIATILLESGADVDAKGNSGGTPLIYAAMHGSSKTFSLLLEAGADITWRDQDGNSAFSHATARGHEKVVFLLLEQISLAESVRELSSGLLYAANGGHEKVVRMLLRHGADARFQDDMGTTPLHMAGLRGHVQVVVLLLQAGADPTIVDGFDSTPITDARSAGHEDLAMLMESLQIGESQTQEEMD